MGTGFVFYWPEFSSFPQLVFGNPKKFPVVESAVKKPLNIYATLKLAAEDLCKIYAENYGIKSRVIRFSGVYTDLDDQLKRVIPRFILAALDNKPLTIEGGKQFFDFVYVDDAIAGVVKCVGHVKNNPEMFNDFTLSTGQSITIKDLAKLIIKLTSSKSKLKFIPARTYDVIGFRGSPRKVNQILKWKAKVGLEAGLKKCIKEFQSSR